MTIQGNGDTFNYDRGGVKSTAELVATVAVDPATGTAQTALPPGRAAAASSVPVVLSTEDKTSLDAANSGYSTAIIYVNNTARAAGRGILANISTGGTATLTFGGVDIAFTFAVGPTILPLAVTKTVLGTAVGSFYAIS